MIRSVAMAGAGNVASALAGPLLESGYEIKGIWSRGNSAAVLSREYRVNVLESPGSSEKPDLWIIAVSDDAISEVDSLIPAEIPRVHTSGSMPLDALQGATRGVFYPLQTFSRGKKAVWKGMPVFTESEDSAFETELALMACRLGAIPQHLDSVSRLRLHLAAVFACNFSNHMYALAADLMDDNQLDFKILLPLIRETAQKLEELHPLEAQTGPAVREDLGVINRHLDLLGENYDLRDLYGSITESIIRRKYGREL
jgi:predicted short-subunit dehydrogenase-like oxidoreductase (DUF2520 family)